MFSNGIERDPFTVKPHYTLFEIDNECVDDGSVYQQLITPEDKLNFFKELYDFYFSIDDSIAELEIEEDATIDQAILHVSLSLWDKHEIEVNISKVLMIGKIVTTKWDIGYQPIRAIFDQRKNQAFFYFLCNILAGLRGRGDSVMNNFGFGGIASYIEDYYLEYEDFKPGDVDYPDKIGWLVAKKTYDLLIQRLQLSIPRDYTFNMNQSIIDFWCRKKPSWAKFIIDAVEVMRLKMEFRHMVPLNIDHQQDNDYAIPLDDVYFWSWDNNSKYDCEIFSHLDNSANEYPVCWPYVIINQRNLKQSIESIKEDVRNSSKLFDLYTNEYDCFGGKYERL